MSRRHPDLVRGSGRPRKPRGGHCGYCGGRVPESSHLAAFCDDSCAARARRARLKADLFAAKPLTPYLAELLATTGGRL